MVVPLSTFPAIIQDFVKARKNGRGQIRSRAVDAADFLDISRLL
jgi:hypothetical protein